MDPKTSSPNTKIAFALAPRKRPEFKFIIMTDPKDIEDSNTKTQIRRHVRESAIRSKRQRCKTPKKLVFDLPEPNSQVQPATIIQKYATSVVERPKDGTKKDDESLSLSLSFLRPIGYGRGLNPLTPLPTAVNARIRHILDYVFSSSKEAYRPLVEVWIAIGMSDKSTFQLIMAHAAVIYGPDARKTQSETAESMKYYNMSLHSVNKRLQDPVDGVSEGVMGTVLGFACYDHMVGNYKRVDVHLNGLKKIIKTRGGIETLKPFHVLRLMMFRVDVSDSFIMDTPPRFPLPNDLVYHFTNEHQYKTLDRIITAWNTNFPHLPDITQALSHIAKMAQYMNDNVGITSVSLWRDEWFMAQRFQPVLYTVLSLPRLDLSQPDFAPEAVMREVLRLTCLTLLSSMNRKFRISLDGTVIYKAKVMKLLTRFPVAWSSFLDLQLWALVVGGLFAEDEIRTWHISETSSIMEQLGLKQWKIAHHIIKGILWVDDLQDVQGQKFGVEVEEFIGQKLL